MDRLSTQENALLETCYIHFKYLYEQGKLSKTDLVYINLLGEFLGEDNIDPRDEEANCNN